MPFRFWITGSVFSNISYINRRDHSNLGPSGFLNDRRWKMLWITGCDNLFLYIVNYSGKQSLSLSLSHAQPTDIHTSWFLICITDLLDWKQIRKPVCVDAIFYTQQSIKVPLFLYWPNFREKMFYYLSEVLFLPVALVIKQCNCCILV